jgi:7-cyano-7-deazaguanine synthase
MSDKMIAIMSGGLDSTTLVYKLLADGYDVDCVSFNYGQKHSIELDYARNTCHDLDLRHDVVPMQWLGQWLGESGSSLITGVEVPEGNYAADNMKSTVVPNRNMIMLSLAGGVAVSRGAVAVATGVHGGDHFVYPDCRTGFIGAAALALFQGNEGMSNLWRAPIWAPYIYKSKAHIASDAIMLGVPLSSTWSCYKGGEKHCGRCGTCVERLEAIDAAAGQILMKREDVDDTEYEDTEYWKTVTR